MAYGDGRYNVVYDVARFEGRCFPTVFFNVLAREIARSIVNECSADCDCLVCFVLLNDFSGFVRGGVCGYYFR